MKPREESSPDDNEKHKREGARKCCGISPSEGLMVHQPQNTFHVQSLLEKESRCFENVAIDDSIENHDYFAGLL